MEVKYQYVQKYQIRDLELISGIKAHTIRIWEQRYKIFNPERSSTNIRFYSDNDLKKLLNIVVLINNGSKISDFKNKTDKEISEMVQTVSFGDLSQEFLLVAVLDFDVYFFNRLVDDSVNKSGFEETVEKLIYPLLERIGILWQTGAISPAHEHFVSNIVRQKFFTQINSFPEPEESKKTFLMFLPFYEQHETGLLYSYYLVRKYGHKVVYLGQNVPDEDVFKTAGVVKPDYIVSFFVSHFESSAIKSILKNFTTGMPETIFLASGIQLAGIKNDISENLKILSTPSEIKSFL